MRHFSVGLHCADTQGSPTHLLHGFLIFTPVAVKTKVMRMYATDQAAHWGEFSSESFLLPEPGPRVLDELPSMERLLDPKKTPERDPNVLHPVGSVVDDLVTDVLDNAKRYEALRPALLWWGRVDDMNNMLKMLNVGDIEDVTLQRLPPDIEIGDDDRVVPLGKLELTGKEIKWLLNEARITHNVPNADGCQLMIQHVAGNQPAAMLHSLAVSGPVYIVSDDAGDALDEKVSAFCVTVVEVDFGHQSQFLDHWGKPSEHARECMTSMWRHVLGLFKEQGLKQAVVQAPGLDAHTIHLPCRGLGDVAYAETLAEAVESDDWGLEVLFVSLPKRKPGGGYQHHDVYHQAMAKKQPKMSVVLTRDHGMLDLAIQLSHKGKYPGILNTVSRDTMTNGTIGRHWNTGETLDMEELLAVHTTVLFHHAAVNQRLWFRPHCALGVSCDDDGDDPPFTKVGV